MKKVLLVTTVSGFVPQFEMNNVKILQQMNCEIHYAANYNIPSYGNDNSRLDDTGIIRHQIDFVRSPYSSKNKVVLKQLKELMEQEKFDLVHCHTPMGGVMARLSAHMTKTAPVIYTAHGFHFYKGAPLFNWLCYYPVERWLSRYTDQIICINKEDYQRARGFKAKYVDYIPGVGIDLDKISVNQINKERKMTELNVPLDKIILLSVGELIPRKNHETVIKAIHLLQDPSIVYMICGQGELESDLKMLVKKYHLENQVLFTGYRTDIMEIYQIAHAFIFPSYQEGLPIALLEAMAFGLPVICSDIRGNSDLMGSSFKKYENQKWKACNSGILVKKVNDPVAYMAAIRALLGDYKFAMRCGRHNKNRALDYTKERVQAKMSTIYRRFI